MKTKTVLVGSKAREASRRKNWLSAPSLVCVQLCYSAIRNLDLTGKSVFPLGHSAPEAVVLLKVGCLAHNFHMKGFHLELNRP